ncbi:MAG TPA: DNA gyrase C-terminal beta-propeller domain-containing protein, partial [Hyphomonas sp.]|nr:DNA gyrase C-terminal beta-propeller domain-containing protein [Hyphomonas sp.]
TSRGKALVNIFPLAADERIESVMPLPESEAETEHLDVMFATRSGTVRRNKLADFVRVNRNGKIAMKLEDETGGDSIVSVRICSEKDDILLTTALGQCIRFPVTDVRVFAGRNSTGVRGIRLGDGDEVISMGILRHVEVTSEEARAYLKHAAAMRRAATGEEEEVSADEDEDDAVGETVLSPERIVELGAAEEFVLTIADDGMGKRSSAFDYRVTGRGGKGLVAQNIWGRDKKKGPVKKVAQSFPVGDGDQVMLVTDGGQLIRTPVDQIRIAGRSTGGVWVLRTTGEERVVSVARLVEDGETAMDGDGGAK